MRFGKWPSPTGIQLVCDGERAARENGRASRLVGNAVPCRVERERLAWLKRVQDDEHGVDACVRLPDRVSIFADQEAVGARSVGEPYLMVRIIRLCEGELDRLAGLINRFVSRQADGKA